MRICLFEDHGAADLEPLASTRPVFELRCGQTSLADKQRRYFGAAATWGVLVRPLLAELYRHEHPGVPVNDFSWLRQEPVVMVNGRWLPPTGTLDSTKRQLTMIGDEVAYAVLGPDQWCDCLPASMDQCIDNWKESLPRRPAPGVLMRYPWDLVEHNAEQLRQDFAHGQSDPSAAIPEGAVVIGPGEQVWLAPTARVEPMVLIDATGGPVVIDRDAVVTAFTRLEGPCYVGPHTQVLGAKVRGGCTFGPQCRIGGEVEASIVHGYSNKCHDGFLGHSYLGEWVNLAAGTHNSDLRNDYGEVSVPLVQKPIRTGLTKVGCFIGDHTKTGLGVLINTGSSIGVFANLLPAGTLAPRYVPPFSLWSKGVLQETADVNKQLATAARVMTRRGRELTEAHLKLYQQLFDDSALLRLRAIQEIDRRRVSQSA